ncbi:MAG TPA: hypothetical protein VF748_15535 [Candidatus Acidoferrum sp.]
MPAPGQTQRAASKFIIFENFEKLNTQEARQALKESEFSWVENLQPVASNNWATVPGPAASRITLGVTFTELFFGVLNGIDYVVGFTTAGGGYAMNLANAAITQFAQNGTFSQSPDMTSWEGERFLFNDSVAGYCSWDGTTFTRQGGVSQNIVLTNGGSGYTSVPLVAITGGSGSGATAAATIGSPQVNGIFLDAGGSGYSAPPAVVFSGGGGSGASATATIDPRAVLSLSLTNVGTYNSNHTITPAIAVSFSGGGGSGAAATASLGVNAAGAFFVQSLTLTAGGSGYTSPPTVVFTPNAGLSTFIPASANAPVGNGAVTGLTLTGGGSGYTSTPSVSFSGGGGSGAAAHATVGGTSVTGITLTNPGHGYLPSDVLTVTITGGGGTGATATAHVAPVIPAGTSVAVFQGRVWLNFFVNGQLIGLQWSGTGGWDDWNVGNASGALTLPDTDLVHQITGLRSFNNFLWIVGDQSIKQIGNISLNASNNVTIFTILTISSDQGTTYLKSCVSFNRVFFFVNQNGVYAVFGSSVQKISGDLDGVFQGAVFPPAAGGLVPQAMLVDMANVHCVGWLLKYFDPVFTNTARALFIIFNGQRWFLGSQIDSLITVTATCTVASPNWVPYASSGGDLTPIFNLATTVVTVRLRTGLSHHQNPVQRKKTVRLGWACTLTSGPGTLTFGIDSDEAVQVFTPTINTGFQTRTVADPNVSGTYLGYSMVATLAGFTLQNLRIEYQETNVGNQN